MQGLVAPEATLATGPFTIGTLNGFASLFDNGLTNCQGGLGDGYQRPCTASIPAANDGALIWTPASPANPFTAVSELSTLLTAGRLSEATVSLIADKYSDFLSSPTLNLRAHTATASSVAFGGVASRGIDGNREQVHKQNTYFAEEPLLSR